jgi:hypothetical protein
MWTTDINSDYQWMSVKQRLIIPNLIKYEYDIIILEENLDVTTFDTKMTHAT